MSFVNTYFPNIAYIRHSEAS